MGELLRGHVRLLQGEGLHQILGGPRLHKPPNAGRQPHRLQLARRVRLRLSRPGLGRVRMQDEEEIAELEARLAKLKKAKVRRVRVRVGTRLGLPASASA